MDGHPDVHAKTIRESCLRHHQLIVNRYFLEAQALAERLSQSASRDRGIAGGRGAHRAVPEPGAQPPSAATPASHDRMPYRVLLGQIAERLRATYDGRSGQYERVEQLVDDLELIARSLAGAPRRECRPVPRAPHAATRAHLRFPPRDARRAPERRRPPGDRRPGARRRAVGASAAAEERRAAARSARSSATSRRSPTSMRPRKRALWVFEAMEFCGHRYGTGRHRFVRGQHGDRRRRRAVGAAAGAMGRARRRPGRARCRWTWRRCSNRSPRSRTPARSSPAAGRSGVPGAPARRAATARSSWSDTPTATRSSGIAASRWLLRRAQAAMAAACDAAGVELLVFHGRGGSISAGGGRTEALVRALPPGVLRGRLRVTEQGESVNERYGLRPIALRSFEQAVHAVALATAGYYGRRDLDPRWLEAMALLAEASRAALPVPRARRSGVPRVLPGRHAGGRHRAHADRLAPDDAGHRRRAWRRCAPIPWMFAWSQSRHMLPGWFGAGTGLAAVRERFGHRNAGRDVRPLAVRRRRCWTTSRCVLAQGGPGHRGVLRPAGAGPSMQRFASAIRATSSSSPLSTCWQ